MKGNVVDQSSVALKKAEFAEEKLGKEILRLR
jgi:hypothetical protein